MLSIKDNGIGISEDDLSKIMDPFFTTKSPEKGTGLSLSIAYEIVAEHGGTISIHSVPDAGAEFILSLPLFKEN